MSTNTSTPDAEQLLTTEQVARMLSLGTITVKRMTKRGELTALRFNQNVVRYRSSEVARYLQSKQQN